MNETVRGSRSPGVLLSIIIVGACGFAAGFFGPMALVPEANQGPLVGILLSGPGGAVLGLLLWVVCQAFGLTAARRWQVLWGASAILVMVTLYFCLPEPELRGYLVDAQVQACRAPSEKVDEAIAYWQKRVSAVTWASPRAGWQDEARRLSQDDNGVVLDVLVLRKNGLYEKRKPWNKGMIVAKGWQQIGKEQSYYIQSPGSCSDFTAGQESVRFTAYDLSALSSGSHDWPPRKVSDFLDLEVLDPVPSDYRKFSEP